ncbi:MAG TPA: condensation domain-containing protein, partial [Longimicrobium sp.]
MNDVAQRLAALDPEQRNRLLQQLRKAGAPRGRIPVQPRDTDTFPVSFTQQRLWFLDRMEPGNPFYNIPSAFRLTGALQADALERSLNELARRHES